MIKKVVISALGALLAFGSMAQSVSSVMQTGKWVKVSVDAEGVYKIPYSKLSEWGFDSPKNVRIFGNDFGMLPFMNNENRPQDLVENRVMYGDDAVYFYAKSKDIWSYDPVEDLFLVKNHLYDNRAYYFVSNVQTNFENRITTQTSAPTAQTVATQGDFFAIHQNDLVNLQMSGRNWYGENFYYAVSQDFDLELPVQASTTTARTKVSVLARSSVANSFIVTVNGSNSKTIACESVSGTAKYADLQTQIFDFKPVAQTTQNVNITFDKAIPSSEGYLDYIIINARGNLVYQNKQLIFRDLQSYKQGGGVEFRIQGAQSGCIVWQITDSRKPQAVSCTCSQNTASFIASAENLEEYVMFSPSDAYIPEFVANVENQNLHAQPSSTMVIITPLQFKPWADKIAQIHSDISVSVTTLDQIYNEFSSGSKDVSAIRDYLRHLYKSTSGDKLRYALLLGDGSVDNLTESSSNPNYIPTYQSPHSLDENELISFVSDDYFALLDDDEGEYTGLPDIGVGRIPVKSEAECETAVKKISLYSGSFFNDWEKNIAFIADDENQNIHVSQADKIAVSVETDYPGYNVYKIYLDAYPRQQTIGGNLYPQAREDILKQFNLGAKIVNFTGHGGINYLTDERILTNADIDNLKNIDNLPVFITSSCDVGRFDYYDRATSQSKDCPAERAIHNPQGGAVAMITAARHAYAEPNFTLNKNIFNHILLGQTDGRTMRLGDVVMKAKQQTDDNNMRCFMLLGDPALVLNRSDFDIKILKINGIDYDTYTDTIKALQKCRLECAVVDGGGVVSSFNGTAHTIFFDKPSARKTLNNSGHGVFEFQDYDKKIFDGFSTVTNGLFTTEFIVPKDIDYKVDAGKVSLFARSDRRSASGSDKNLIVGSADGNAQPDNYGPQIELYINSTDFADGGSTNSSPMVIAILSDTSGINITSEHNGHEISLSIDGGTPISLNSFYKTDPDTYTRGSVQYQVQNLAEGHHSLKIKVYDNYNNMSQAELSFVVVKDEGLKITRLLNYPNPFTDHTKFYFQHNSVPDLFEYELTIFSISGKQVKTLTGSLSYSGNLSQPISWDGLDDFGSKIARGTYIYRLRIRDTQGRKATAYEKLLYLK
ncbi:MAG: type IX secretion system sortase PorU [Bacteroidales bacterium]|nr:type IX secretion system sortase PorU [Bacteroidales bacterium]